MGYKVENNMCGKTQLLVSKSVQIKGFLLAGNGNLTFTDIFNYEVIIYMTFFVWFPLPDQNVYVMF